MNPVSKFTPRIRRERTALSNPDLSTDAVQVYCRLRPLKNNEQSKCVRLSAPDQLILTTPTESRGIRKEVLCKFKHIFCEEASQQEVFKEVAFPMLEDLLKGRNGLLFTYGITGSGKTFTLTGDEENPGVMPKCIYTLFNSIKSYQAQKFVIKPDRMNAFEIQSHEEIKRDEMQEQRSAGRAPQRQNFRKIYVDDGCRVMDINQSNLYSVFVSYVEIYNNTVFDLLDESSGKSAQSKILREDANRNIYVNGVVEVEVRTAEEAFEYFNMGQKRKRMGNTILNSVSSRSHSIFNIRVVQIQQQTQEGQIPEANYLKVSQMSLVDLAGSERTNRTQNTGQLLREASQINNSLMTLRNCMEILRDNQINGSNKLVPYRDSRLTLLFKNYFEGEGKVVMIVCMNPSVEDFEENFQVTKFAEFTKDIKITRSEPKYTPCKKTTVKKHATPATTPGKLKNAGSFKIGPKLPAITLNFHSPEEMAVALEKLTAALKTRTSKTLTFYTEMDKRESHFRKRLMEVNQQNILNIAEVKSNRAQLKKEKQKIGVLESKLMDMEMMKNELNNKLSDYEGNIRQLEKVISEKDMRINKNLLEKERTKQKLALQNERMTHELDAKLRRQREHLQAAMNMKEHKIRKVREILDGETSPDEVFSKENQVPDEKKSSEPTYELATLQTPSFHQTVRRTVVNTPGGKNRRRSRSAGEVWLEHNSVKPVALNTVLQPAIKKRKSVTKLSKASDVTNPKQSKYCLIAQEQDTDGELETKVYKADILPTCGGGAQVVFNDVEKLTQQSPTK